MPAECDEGHICGHRYSVADAEIQIQTRLGIRIQIRIRLRMCLWQLFLIYAWRLKAFSLPRLVVINQSVEPAVFALGHIITWVCRGGKGERVKLQPDFTQVIKGPAVNFNCWKRRKNSAANSIREKMFNIKLAWGKFFRYLRKKSLVKLNTVLQRKCLNLLKEPFNTDT